jgi:phage-related minor tail protein
VVRNLAGGRIKGITVEIGGDTQGLDRALNEVNQQSRKLQGELRDVERLLKFDPGNATLAAQQQELLSEAVENTEKKLQQLKDAQEQVEAQFEAGDIGADQYRAFQREIVATENELTTLTRRLEAVDETSDVDEVTEDVKQLDRAANKAGDTIKRMGTGLGTAAKGMAGLAAAGGAAIGGLIAGTQELGMDLAKMRFNALENGFNVDMAEEGFQKIVAVSGEADSAVETLANLMQTGFDDQQLSQVIDHVNGAAIRFSDTLKTEGIADGLQETFATGKAIGQFGELLERSGVNLDDFNAGLTEAKKNGTETDYVLQQLAALGLSETSAGFNEASKTLMAQQKAQIALQTALADLGVALTPLMTMVTNFLAKLAEWGVENVNLVSSFDSISEGLTALLPQLFGKGLEMVSTIVQAVVENLPMILSTGTQILLAVINGIIQMLPSLIAQIQTMIPLITSILMTNLPLIISAGIDLLLALLRGIVQMLPQLIDMAIQLIVLVATELLNHLPEIISAGVEIIFALIDGLVDAIPDIIDAIVFDILPAIVDTLLEFQMSDIGEDIMQGLIDGINNMAENVWKAAKNIASGIGEKIAQILDLGSPSKVLIRMGEDTGEGMEIGLSRSIYGIQDQASEMAKSVVSSVSQVGAQMQTGNWAENMISGIVDMLDVGGAGKAVQSYFQAIVEDGDWLNDWLTHMPAQVQDYAKQLGFVLANDLEGSNAFGWNESKEPYVTKPNLNVTINSPKQLNAREANTVWNRQMKKMQLQW